MVIGGGTPELYGIGFFEVGGHPTSNFGKDRDWKDPKFWTVLDDKLGDKKFKAIIIDKGSVSHLQNINLNSFCLTIIKHISDEGVVLIEGPSTRPAAPDDIYSQIRQGLFDIGLIPIGKIGFRKVIDDDIYTLYSPGTAEILHKTNINPPEMIVGTWDPRGFIQPNPDFKYVSEPNQIEFIRDRLF
jgi:hypothetical protein